jgi:hypothetical protein
MNSASPSRRIVLVIMAIALVALAIGVAIYAKLAPNTSTAPQTVPTNQRVSVINGLTVIQLAPAIQEQSGIRTALLTATTHQVEATAYGTVMDLQPLIELRARYAAAQAEHDASAAAASASGQEFARSRLLSHDNQNVSQKAFQATQAAYLADRAKREAADLNLKNIKGLARQQFGDTLGNWGLDPHSPQVERLLTRQEVLLRITMPIGDSVQTPATIAIAANNTQRFPASLISAAAQSDATVQGSAFIYRTAASIAAGTNIVAYMPTSNPNTQGFVIPANAVVWYGGQPWAYVQIDATHSVRRPIDQQSPADGGFFVAQGFKAGERIVVSGAQLLLSEELRPAAASTGCKDPECD